MSKKTLNDIGGYKCQKQEVAKIIDFLKNYETYTAKGASLPRGIIFYGAPGTGKTMFAHVIANESKRPLIKLDNNVVTEATSLSSSIKKTFQEAVSKSPSILLIDEIDQIVNSSPYDRNESDSQRAVLRALLTEIDNCMDKGVLILATANTSIHALPAALVRNGRIEKHIKINRPTFKEREEILKLYFKNHPEFDGVKVEDVSSYTEGFTGSDLASLVNDVLIGSIQNNRNVKFSDFIEPINVIKCNGIKKDSEEDDNSDVIYHEIGHFLADYKLNGEIGMINVIPYGETLGNYNMISYNHNDDDEKRSKTKVINDCIIAAAGLVSTEIFLGEPYVGASDDFSKIKDNYLGLIQSGIGDDYIVAVNLLSGERYNDSHSDYKAVTADGFREFLIDVKARAREIVESSKDLAQLLYSKLKEKCVLSHEEINEIVRSYNS